ncbi:MAG TPA: biotin/lipoyl-containing protein, partial [Stellaceae bacterium]|nr:biotin/lipoyl-containing protein [Stellaceae bacterium]
MATEIKVPALGESVNEATVARWLKQVGDAVAMDDPLVELETDKVTLEVNAPAAGTLSEILAPEGANVAVGAVLGNIGEGAAKVAAAAKPAPVAAVSQGAAKAPAPAGARPAPAAA